MKRISIFFVIVFASCQVLAQTATAPSGTGTNLDPYLIETLDNLYWVSTNVASSSGKYYTQTANIDASSTSTWFSSAGWAPIGYDVSHRFFGNYDGGGYTISGLFINRPATSYIGLFGWAAIGPIKNLGLTNVNITGYNYTGGLVGAMDGGILLNCYSTGSVACFNSSILGGLAGSAETTTISYCFSSCNVSATGTTQGNYIGGLAGLYTSYSAGSNTLNDCYATGTVKGGNNGLAIGGFVGNLDGSGSVNNCYSTGDVGSLSVTGAYGIGGFAGYIHSNTIRNCYSTGNVIYANQWAGGFVGYSEAASTITNCYSSGNVTRQTGGSQVDLAGFIGNSRSTISNCYRVGSIIYTGTTNPINKGFVGTDVSGSYSNNFFDSETSAQSTGTGATAKTTTLMKTQSTFTDATCDFLVESTNGTNNYWEMNSGFNNGYPILSWQSVEVTGITTTPNIVSNSNIGFTAQIGSISLNFVEMNAAPSNLPGGSVTINKYWEVSDITGGDVKLRLYYLPSLTASFTGTPKIIHYNGSSWEVLATEPEVIAGLLKYVETTNYYSSFSPVTIGDNASPLPVELASFTASLSVNAVNLNWQTATEVNNYGFEVQRSVVSGQRSEWEKVGFVEGNGNSNSPKEYSFEDESLKNGKYSYRLKQIDIDGKFEYSEEIEVDIRTRPLEFNLAQNYPNPFNPTTVINFAITESGHYTLKIYNTLGQEVAELVNDQLEGGNYSLGFDAFQLASGLYIYNINGTNVNISKKMILLK